MFAGSFRAEPAGAGAGTVVLRWSTGADTATLRADFAKRCAEIERQISELTCLEATVNAELAAHRESLAVMA